MIFKAARFPRVARLAYLQITPPERVGPYLYYVGQLPDQPHPCYMRKPAAGGGQEEVLLDVNALAIVHGEAISVGQVRRELVWN